MVSTVWPSLFGAVLCAISASAGAEAPATPAEMTNCSQENQPLAFWLGHWDVFEQGKLDGHNFIESTLGGCAVLEHWDDVSGMRGLSVFYYEPHSHLWKQVWITDHARTPGGLKEKILIHAGPDEVRFQGAVWATADRMILDRTTLKKVDDTHVRQIIERSADGGTTWTVGYDALYQKATVARQADHPAAH